MPSAALGVCEPNGRLFNLACTNRLVSRGDITLWDEDAETRAEAQRTAMRIESGAR